MLALKYLMLAMFAVLSVAAVGIAIFNLWVLMVYYAAKRGPLKEGETEPVKPGPIDWPRIGKLAALSCVPLLLAESITVVPSGNGGVHVSASSGTLSGTLYPGTHFVVPVLQHVETFDLRDKLFTTGEIEDGTAKPGVVKEVSAVIAPKQDALKVQSKEGLSIGLAITVRYHLDPNRLDYVQSHLPQPVETEIVPPVVASAWREVAPNYTVRDIFSAKREEVRAKAADSITKKLAADGIIVKEVMLRDIQLPPEYAKGLNDLLLKEQQDDQLNIQTDMQAKQVKIAELEAEAQKAQKVKAAEGDAEAKVIEAKSEADSMQYTLPLKQKQIEQSRFEAQARKEATIENADAEAQAKVIDSKAEVQRRNLLADAEANRIRVTSEADALRMKREGNALSQSPLLINKIIADRLSDKIQLMMVPSDGKYFFANDVFKSAAGSPGANAAVKESEAEEDTEDSPPAKKDGQLARK